MVLAVPSYVASHLVRPIDGALASELDGIEYGPICVVHLGYRRREAAVLIGFGFLAPSQERLRILGAIFISSIFAWRSEEHRTLGGARQLELFNLEDGELLATVRADLQRTTGLSEVPCFQKIVRWRRGIPQYNVGHLGRLRRIDESVSKLRGLTRSRPERFYPKFSEPCGTAASLAQVARYVAPDAVAAELEQALVNGRRLSLDDCRLSRAGGSLDLPLTLCLNTASRNVAVEG